MAVLARKTGYNSNMATVVNMHDAKSSLSRLVKRAASGEEILIANHGKPVALLSRIPDDHTKIPWDIFKGKMEMADDFDAPLDEFKDYM
jgi:antitoxin (DNA-binding transcriptional repressor) of toxin-antitoxin stability system